MPVCNEKDIALIGQQTVLATRLTEASAIVPFDDIVQAEKDVANLIVDSEETAQQATALASKFSGWSSRIETYFKGIGKYYWDRYKIFNRAADEGVRTGEVEIIGTERLNRAKMAAESKVKAFIQRQKQELIQRQAAMERAVRADINVLDKKIEQLADSGKMAEARELMREREISSQAPVVIAQPTNVGSAAVAEVVKWSIVPGTGLMDLVKAIASGQVPLYREVTTKGMPEMRPVFLINEVVLNQATRAMGKNLNWPGVVVEDDINLRTRKS